MQDNIVIAIISRTTQDTKCKPHIKRFHCGWVRMCPSDIDSSCRSSNAHYIGHSRTWHGNITFKRASWLVKFIPCALTEVIHSTRITAATVLILYLQDIIFARTISVWIIMRMLSGSDNSIYCIFKIHYMVAYTHCSSCCQQIQGKCKKIQSKILMQG